MKRHLYFLAAWILAGFATTVMAQTPADLSWKWMRDASFDANNLFLPTASESEKKLLEKIWAKEIRAAGVMEDGGRYPSFAVIGTFEHQGTAVILTMYDRADYVCDPAPNGRGAVDLFSTCPLRVIRINSNGQYTVQNLPKNFCMLYGDDPNNPREKKHLEYAFDERSGIVYLRLIQHGKIAASCNRSVRIFKG